METSQETTISTQLGMLDAILHKQEQVLGKLMTRLSPLLPVEHEKEALQPLSAEPVPPPRSPLGQKITELVARADAHAALLATLLTQLEI